MSWIDVDFSELTTESRLIPEGKYVVEVVGAKSNPWTSGKTDFTLKVVEGEYKGYPLYGSYPGFTEENKDRIGPMYARLFSALGDSPKPEVDGTNQEGFINFLNRMKGETLVAPVKHRTVEQEGGEPQTKADVKIGNFTKVKVY